LSSLIAGVNGEIWLWRDLAGFRVLSAVECLTRRMLASDGGSAEVVHALGTADAVAGINGDGLIRAMRPGGDAPLERLSVALG
jgi:hypothetical protein